MKLRTLFLAGLVFAGFALPAVASDKLPADVELFFKNPRYAQMTLSPDGRYLAALAPSKGTERRNIALIDLKDRSKSRFLTNIKEMDVAGFFWKGNDWVVFTMDSDGNESFGLYSVAIKGGPVKALVDASKLPWGATAQVLNDLEDEPDEILIQLNEKDRRYFDVLRLNVKNGKQTMVERNDHTIVGWGTDTKGRVRIAQRSDGGVKTETLYRSIGSDEWKVINTSTFPEPSWGPVGFDFDDRTMYIATNVGHDKAAIYTYDPETQKLGRKVFAHDVVDAGGLMASRARQKILGVTYYTDKPQREIWDQQTKELYGMLQAEFPGLDVSISSMTKDENLMTLVVGSDREPGAYYLFDRMKLTLEFVAKSRPEIDASKMSPMKPFEFTARDGLVVRGYITVPKDAKGPVPLIVNPHGGPFGVRDFWGFNPEHQFFANRGYATMQVNYRGSGGYGRSFEHAGYGKWGREMQNDLTDAVKWAVSQGLAKADQVCIYGASYGGYATMAGLTYTPELYKCGVNYVGVTDIPLLFTSMPKYWEPQKEFMKLQIGNPDEEAGLEKLKSQSPLYAVDRIRAPVFIVQGGRDPRVVRKHAELLRDEMKKMDKPYEWLLKENEGHGFRKEENRLELYTLMGEFFAKHLAPPRTNAAP